jgi:hypothetical protein
MYRYVCLKDCVLMARSALKNKIHTSSFYALKLASFLRELSLKRSELQACFESDMDCQESISTDTIRLYADALEDLGSTIERPNATNGYRYTLHYLPLAIQLNAEEWQQFCDLLHDVLAGANIHQFVRLYKLVYSLVNSLLFDAERKQQLVVLLEGYVSQPQFDWLLQLQQAVSHYSYFDIHYQGTKELHHWRVAHETVVIYDGRLYWLCYQHNPQTQVFTPMMLRLNRCYTIVPTETMDYTKGTTPFNIHHALKTYLKQFNAVEVDVLMPQGINFTPPNLPHEHYMLLQMHEETPLPQALLSEIKAFYGTHLYTTRYAVQTAHMFYLKQSLQATGGFLVPRNATALALLNHEGKG